ncbi:MAG: hydroxyacid dehydrogenase [Acidiferrobacterales bacterium]
MPEIVISEFMNDSAVAELTASYDVYYDPSLVERADALRAKVAGARALIVRNRTQVERALLDIGTRLQVIGRLGVGLDNIDMEACKARGITVIPATGANVVSVAEYVITGALMLLRGAFQATSNVLAGEWPRTALIGREVSGKTLGLIGFGAIARAVASRATSLGMRVIGHDPLVVVGDPVWRERSVAPHVLADVLRAADVVSLHVPLNPETRGLIDRDALALMKPGASLINTARGGVVDETALAGALRARSLGGALLDVYETEPLTADSHLLDVPNLILTPHIAGLTEESNERVGTLIAMRVRQILEGTP